MSTVRVPRPLGLEVRYHAHCARCGASALFIPAGTRDEAAAWLKRQGWTIQTLGGTEAWCCALHTPEVEA